MNMRIIFTLLLAILLAITISSSIYYVAIDDIAYAQLYFQPLEDQQPSATFNNQPSQVELLPRQQTPIKKFSGLAHLGQTATRGH